MKQLIPCLWFDKEAEEAARHYTSIFPAAKLGDVARYGEASAAASGLPKDSVMTVTFELAGGELMALNGGPAFKFSPAISLFVNASTVLELDTLWSRLKEGGRVLMELDKYPFSDRYGWVEDRFGVSWQLSLARRQQKIAPFLTFVGERYGKAEEAVRFYVATFEGSRIQRIDRHGSGSAERAGTVQHAVFSLGGHEVMAMESGLPHAFDFTPAISLMAMCETQKEIDVLWDRLLSGGTEEQCGWLKDRYGVSWQIVPTELDLMMRDKDAAKVERVTAAMLQMKKLDIQALRRAYR